MAFSSFLILFTFQSVKNNAKVRNFKKKKRKKKTLTAEAFSDIYEIAFDI